MNGSGSLCNSHQFILKGPTMNVKWSCGIFMNYKEKTLYSEDFFPLYICTSFLWWFVGSLRAIGKSKQQGYFCVDGYPRIALLCRNAKWKCTHASGRKKKYFHAPGFFGKEQSNNKNSKLRFQAEIIELSSAREASCVSHFYVQSFNHRRQKGTL